LSDLQAISTRSKEYGNKERHGVRGVCAHYLFVKWE